MISSITDNVQWIEKKPALPTGLQECGYILYKHYLIIFGGSDSNDEFVDSIHLLKLQDGDEWKKKCWKEF